MAGIAPYSSSSSSSSSSLKILKRKEVDEVSDDFSDFSLSAPSRKIRRLVLDAELPTIIEEEEGSTVPGEFGEEEGDGGLISNEQRKNQGVAIEEVVMQESSAATSDNEERAIVLFKPVSNLHLLHRSPNNFSVSLDSNIISGFKNQFLWLSQSGGARSVEEEEEAGARRDDSMAVVPWVPQAQPAFVQEIMYNNASVPQTELMDSEEMGEAAMDIEEDNNDLNHNASVGLGQAQGNQAFGFGGIRAGSDGHPQWQQQHCLVPQIPQNPNPTPITWIP